MARTPFRLVRHPWLRHLRLPFNAILTPIWGFGVVAALRETGAPVEPGRLALAWASLHVFLYGGTTAFNSFYDRDTGPVGGMLRPPAVDAGLRPFSLAVQAVGLALAAGVGAAFLGSWAALFAVFTAYSHPAVRLKRDPRLAMTAIALGQGALGFALGWATVAGLAGLATPWNAARMAVTALLVAGLYVVTQAYQVREDAARGDRTLPVRWGAPRALRAAAASLAAGALVLAADVTGDLGVGAGAIVVVGAAAASTALLRWAGRFDPGAVAANFRIAMRFAVSASLAASALLLAWAFAP
jgi:1,4-dihydroxy-2-naphthoate octaprenyltransferase